MTILEEGRKLLSSSAEKEKEKPKETERGPEDIKNSQEEEKDKEKETENQMDLRNLSMNENLEDLNTKVVVYVPM